MRHLESLAECHRGSFDVSLVTIMMDETLSEYRVLKSVKGTTVMCGVLQMNSARELKLTTGHLHWRAVFQVVIWEGIFSA